MSTIPQRVRRMRGGFLTMMGRVLLFDSMIYIAFFAIFIILLGL